MIENSDGVHPNCAVVDIGSNSVRMVLYDRRAWPPLPVYNDKVACQLARGLQQTGMIDPARMQQALGVLSRFSVIIRHAMLEEVLIYATAASRDASNGAEFIQQIETMFDQPVTILAGEEEARLSAHGVWCFTEATHGIVGDLGGGSLELAELDDNGVGNRVSLPLGALRLMDMSDGQIDRATALIETHCRAADDLLTGTQPALHIVGGAWRAIAKAHMAANDYPLRIIHGYVMEHKDSLDFCQSLIELPVTSVSGVSKKRMESLPFAAALLAHIIRTSGAEKIHISAAGLREGAILDRIAIPASSDERLRAGCARLGGVMPDDRRAVALTQWIAPMFQDVDPAIFRLIEASCLLVASARRAHPTYRAQQAFFLVLRSPILTISHDQRAFLALSLLFRLGGNRKTRGYDHATMLLSSDMMRLARTVGLAQRLADNLSGGLPELLAQSKLSINMDRLVLLLPDEQLRDETTEARLIELAEVARLSGSDLYQGHEEAVQASSKMPSTSTVTFIGKTGAPTAKRA